MPKYSLEATKRFESVIKHIFNNWTALRLAIEHSMGGPLSKKMALEFENDIVAYCLSNKCDEDSLEDKLDDYLDENFNIECEDGSTSEIACLLMRFVDLIEDSQKKNFEIEFNKLAINKEITNSQQMQFPSASNVQLPSVTLEPVVPNNVTKEESQIPMELDFEWTQVKSRKRRTKDLK